VDNGDGSLPRRSGSPDAHTAREYRSTTQAREVAMVNTETGRILVVDDDPTVAEVVARYLMRDGYDVDCVADGHTALQIAAERLPDLVVLDLMLPGIDGLEVCRRLRERWPVPIVMLTALGEETDRLVGLETGADDYVTKPFSPRELALRVRSVLRRARGALAPTGGTVTDGDLTVDTAAHEVRLGDQEIPLTAREFDLLAFLMRHPRQAFTRADLLEKVWGWEFGDSSTVTVHVRRLREKIEEDPTVPLRILTVWGVGYRYEPTT
jgi:DNA-binding response OmpR family regulator